MAFQYPSTKSCISYQDLLSPGSSGSYLPVQTHFRRRGHADLLPVPRIQVLPGGPFPDSASGHSALPTLPVRQVHSLSPDFTPCTTASGPLPHPSVAAAAPAALTLFMSSSTLCLTTYCLSYQLEFKLHNNRNFVGLFHSTDTRKYSACFFKIK